MNCLLEFLNNKPAIPDLLFKGICNNHNLSLVIIHNLLKTNKKFLLQNFCNYQIPLPLPS